MCIIPVSQGVKELKILKALLQSSTLPSCLHWSSTLSNGWDSPSSSLSFLSVYHGWSHITFFPSTSHSVWSSASLPWLLALVLMHLVPMPNQEELCSCSSRSSLSSYSQSGTNCLSLCWSWATSCSHPPILTKMEKPSFMRHGPRSNSRQRRKRTMIETPEGRTFPIDDHIWA